MNLERETRFHQLLAEALDREPEERRRFLDSACAGDRDLVEEVLLAASREEDVLHSFLDRPALAEAAATRVDRSTERRASRALGASSSSSPPTSILARLRSTRGVGVFLLMVAVAPLLIGAAAAGAAAMLAAANVELGFSSLNGRVRFVSAERWPGVRWDDEIVAIDGVAVAGDSERVRAAMLALEPGPVTIRFRRGEKEWDATARATPHTWASRTVTWTRVATGALLLAIGASAFVLRPGTRVTWLFLAFCSALGLHLLSYLALLAHPPEGIVVEALGFYLSAGAGLHLFTAFPTLLFRRRLWAAGLYLPALAALLVMAPLYRDGASYSLVATTIWLGSILAAVAAAGAAGLLVLHHRRARRTADPVAQARSRALLVAVAIGLVLPAFLGAAKVVEVDLDWAFNSFLVVVFVAITAYSIVRHNALEVDRFTAAVLGYAATTVVLAAAFAAVVVGIPALVGTAGPLRSPWTSAAVTALFFALASPIYRRIRRRVDRWFLRERVEDDTAMRLLRKLADSVRTAELSETFRVGLETAMVLHADRAELWTSTPEGTVVRFSGTGDSSPAGGLSVAEDSPLVAALARGSGGVQGLADRALDPEAQQELWTRDLALAAPVFVDDRLHGFVALGRKKSGTGYTRRERAFVDTLASHLGIAMERGWGAAERLGPYRILERLGTGGMAEVYLADKHGPGGFELRVAMKRILPHLAQDPACVAMFLDEARIAAQLRHPNIVRIHDIEELEGTYFLAMEYMDGPTLDALIRAAAERRVPLPLPVTAAMASAVLAALHYAHQKKDRRGQPLGLVHRDVKPGNILLSREGEIKLTDFGIARAEFRLYQTQPGHARGTPAYMAPEQQSGAEVGPAADLFATGAVIYEALTGRRAFPAGPRRVEPVPVSRLEPRLPPALDDFARRALAEDPAGRFASAAEMRAAFLSSIAPHLPASAEEVAAAVADFVPAAECGKIDSGSRSGTARWQVKTAATLRNY